MNITSQLITSVSSSMTAQPLGSHLHALQVINLDQQEPSFSGSSEEQLTRLLPFEINCLGYNLSKCHSYSYL